MLKEDYQRFSALWKAVVGIYGREIDDLAVGMVFRSLSRYTVEQVQKALDCHMMDSSGGKFMPKPADIVKHIEGDPEGKALLAWSKFLGAIARPGVYETVVFDDLLIMAVVENMGGWIKWELVGDKELPYLKNDFVKLYKSFQITPPARYPNKLIGKAEAQNEITGFRSFIKPPSLIGDETLALQVYQSGATEKDRPKRLESGSVKAIEFAGGVSDG